MIEEDAKVQALRKDLKDKASASILGRYNELKYFLTQFIFSWAADQFFPSEPEQAAEVAEATKAAFRTSVEAKVVVTAADLAAASDQWTCKTQLPTSRAPLQTYFDTTQQLKRSF